jgi:hypothetical protein
LWCWTESTSVISARLQGGEERASLPLSLLLDKRFRADDDKQFRKEQGSEVIRQNDLRFLFGAKFDVAKLLARIGQVAP